MEMLGWSWMLLVLLLGSERLENTRNRSIARRGSPMSAITVTQRAQSLRGGEIDETRERELADNDDWHERTWKVHNFGKKLDFSLILLQ
jgi:hypothetical protein